MAWSPIRLDVLPRHPADRATVTYCGAPTSPPAASEVTRRELGSGCATAGGCRIGGSCVTSCVTTGEAGLSL